MELLIELYGIEILDILLHFATSTQLLIELYGIEILYFSKLLRLVVLLIELYGIEITPATASPTPVPIF